MSDSDDSADIVKRVRGTVEGVTEEAEDVSEKAQKEITEALDELEQHVESLRNQDEGGKQYSHGSVNSTVSARCVNYHGRGGPRLLESGQHRHVVSSRL
jgi:hypothetical protein